MTTDVTAAPAGLVLLIDRVADSLLGLTDDREAWGATWADSRDEVRPDPRASRAPGSVVDLDAHRGTRSPRALAAPATLRSLTTALPTGRSSDPSGAATDADLRLRRRAAIEQASRRRARRRLRRLGLRVR